MYIYMYCIYSLGNADITKIKCLVCNQNIRKVETDTSMHAADFKNSLGIHIITYIHLHIIYNMYIFELMLLY
jgi:hypothetical protein